MLEKNYTLEWLDFIIHVTLNPAKSDLTAISAKQLETITAKANEEKDQHIQFLKHQSLQLASKRKLQLLIGQYHTSLVMLLDQAYENASAIAQSQWHLSEALGLMCEYIEELLNFVEHRFSDFLSLDERVPARYLSQLRKEIQQRLEILKAELFVRVDNQKLTDIVVQSLHHFIYDSKGRAVSFREVFYKKELVAALEKINEQTEEIHLHQAIVEQLVYLNFNSRSFMNYFTHKLAQKVNACSSVHEKMTQLLLGYKEFNQMHKKPGVKLVPQHGDLKKVLGNWFAQEITYLEKKHQWDVLPLQTQQVQPKEKNEPFKVMCFLSVDQIALLLRAMDSTRILKAKSFNAVMQSITPYLSTPRKEHISYDSMRNKAYSFEEGDRKTVIETLEKMIDWIKEAQT